MDLKTRATNMVMKPAAEWPVIAGEHTTAADLITGYAAPLAAISAVCTFLGQSFIGISLPMMGTVRVGIVRGFSAMIVSFVLGLVGLYIAAIVIEKLAPSFQSKGDTTQALKLVVFSMTPAWLAGVLNLIPALGILGILAALYAIYLFYLGVPQVMHTPAAQVIPYMVVAAIVMVIITICVSFIVGIITGIGALGGV